MKLIYIDISNSQKILQLKNYVIFAVLIIFIMNNLILKSYIR
jgi:hypothetical protein